MVCARMINILNLIDDARCFETVRAMRWPQGVTCPHCDSPQVTKQGHDESQPERQKSSVTVCRKRFDDLTGTILVATDRYRLDALPLFYGAESLE